MSETFVTFEIKMQESPSPSAMCGWQVNVRPAVFDEVLRIGFSPPQADAPLRLRISEHDPRCDAVLALITREGWQVYGRRLVPLHLRDRFFSPLQERIYGDSDLDACELLRVTVSMDPKTWGKCDIAASIRRDGSTLLLHDIPKDRRSKLEFGRVTSKEYYLAVARVKDGLESAGLVGLLMLPTRLESGRPSKKPLWQLSSSIVLPPCLTPRHDDNGEDFDAAQVVADPKTYQAVYWDDQGHLPEELRFRRAEVLELGTFDVAITAEKIGEGNPDMWAPSIIVSQRFRATMKALKVEHHYYAPVHLV